MVSVEGVQDTRSADELEQEIAAVTPRVQPPKNVKIQSPDHIVLLKSYPNATSYGSDITLV